MNTPIDENRQGASLQGGDRQTQVTPQEAAPVAQPDAQTAVNNNANPGGFTDDTGANINATLEAKQTNTSTFDEAVEINPNRRKLVDLQAAINNDPAAVATDILSSPQRARELSEEYGFGANNVPAFQSVVKTIAANNYRFKSNLETQRGSILGDAVAVVRPVLDAFMSVLDFKIAGVTLPEVLVGGGLIAGGLALGAGLFSFIPMMARVAPALSKVAGIGILGGEGLNKANFAMKAGLGLFDNPDADGYVDRPDYREIAERTSVTTTASLLGLRVMASLKARDFTKQPRMTMGLSPDTKLLNFNQDLLPYNPSSPTLAIDAPDNIIYAHPPDEVLPPEPNHTVIIPNDVHGSVSATVKAQRNAYRKFWDSTDNPMREHMTIDQSEFYNQLTNYEVMAKTHSVTGQNLASSVHELNNDRIQAIARIGTKKHPREPITSDQPAGTHQYIQEGTYRAGSMIDIENGGAPTPLYTPVKGSSHLPYSAPNKNFDYKTLSPYGYGGVSAADASSGLTRRGVAVYPKYGDVDTSVEHYQTYMSHVFANNNGSSDIDHGTYYPTIEGFLSEPKSEMRAIPYHEHMSITSAISNVLSNLIKPRMQVSALNLKTLPDSSIILDIKNKTEGHVGDAFSAFLNLQLVGMGRAINHNPTSIIDTNVEEAFMFQHDNPNHVALYLDPFNNNQSILKAGYKGSMQIHNLQKEDGSYDFISPFETLRKDSEYDTVKELYQTQMFQSLSKSLKDTVYEKDLRSALVSMMRSSVATKGNSGEEIGTTKTSFNNYKKFRYLIERETASRLVDFDNKSHLPVSLARQFSTSFFPKLETVENPLLLDPALYYMIAQIPLPERVLTNKSNFDESDLTEDEWDDVRDHFLAYYLTNFASTSPTISGDTHRGENELRMEPTVRPTSLLKISGNNIGVKLHRPYAGMLNDLQIITKLHEHLELLGSIIDQGNGIGWIKSDNVKKDAIAPVDNPDDQKGETPKSRLNDPALEETEAQTVGKKMDEVQVQHLTEVENTPKHQLEHPTIDHVDKG